MGVQQAGGITLPFLPAAPDIVKHLTVTAAYSTIDDTGMHVRSGGSMPAGDPVIVTGCSAGLVAILLPSLSRARELSKRLVSASNLKGISTQCKIYANENAPWGRPGAQRPVPAEKRYPPNLQTLVDSGKITSRQLQNPRVGDPEKPDQYVYIPGHTEAGDPTLVVAYANPVYVTEGINIVYLDGHAEFVRGEEALQQIRATYTNMGLPVPELAYKTDKSRRLLDKFNPESARKN
jgi:prepilin-type processing-associated H-X9-DG protein